MKRTPSMKGFGKGRASVTPADSPPPGPTHGVSLGKIKNLLQRSSIDIGLGDEETGGSLHKMEDPLHTLGHAAHEEHAHRHRLIAHTEHVHKKRAMARRMFHPLSGHRHHPHSKTIQSARKKWESHVVEEHTAFDSPMHEALHLLHELAIDLEAVKRKNTRDKLRIDTVCDESAPLAIHFVRTLSHPAATTMRARWRR